ncbi:carbamoyl-phosphate-synthetase [Candidatus Roizmanbacteria bacterium CG_4_10_14_0_8_um_filter_39_9]|uniref:Carbamoyl-phosphate-synthetase n=1 Tax=Candidatus Roizmanbacteria bacterium CG_4_10_14_0_8_um_filter_39_9 TaxID=1974829 RepID=A0A2M7QCT6_9BACT|nr:MAG: carbamoyl-phosphate-synthetase [Candidatus Roizmanbacteria bacterium CG_4_10_14_0_8_um_filter_39_9]
MRQKKILLLGGSHQQIPSVTLAKKMGYYVITCDYLPNNPGHKFAHEYYNVSTTDKVCVLDLAKKLQIDGILCYASDPSAPTAAYVAEKIGLAGNPYSSIEILTNKDLFRKFLSENGFHTPKAHGYSALADAICDINSFKMPVMVKPVDSSGSKGITKISSKQDLKKAVEYALKFSRNKRFVVEEFIVRKGYQVSGDGFIVKGRLVFRCFGNDHFDSASPYPFSPVGSSYPLDMPTRIHDKIHSEIQRLFTLLKMKTGACNFDIQIDNDDNIYIIEIGPRNGGNSIPQVIKYATGVDMLKYSIKASMGDDCSDLQMVPTKGFWSANLIYANYEGTLKTVQIEKSLKKNNIVDLAMFMKRGATINPHLGYNNTLGIMILKYSSMTEMLEKINNIQKYVKIIPE